MELTMPTDKIECIEQLVVMCFVILFYNSESNSVMEQDRLLVDFRVLFLTQL
jgi:hypothetical protein